MSGCESTSSLDDRIDDELSIREAITNNFCDGGAVTSFSKSKNTIVVECGKLWDTKRLVFIDRNPAPSLKEVSLGGVISLASYNLDYDSTRSLKSKDGIDNIGYYVSEIGEYMGCNSGSESRLSELNVTYMPNQVLQISQQNYCVDNINEPVLLKELCSYNKAIFGHSGISSEMKEICFLEAETPVAELDLSNYTLYSMRPKNYSKSNKVSYGTRSKERFEEYLSWIGNVEATLCQNNKVTLKGLSSFTCGSGEFKLGLFSDINKIATYATLDCPGKGFESLTMSNDDYKFKCK